MKREYVIPDFLAAVTADALLSGRPRLRADERAAVPGEYPPVSLLARGGHAVGVRRIAKGTKMKTISRFFDWLNSAMANAERERNEAYLAQAIDAVDLEYRIRQLERSAIANLRGW
jgi:hypothetical protein